MKAVAWLREKLKNEDGDIIQTVIWRVPPEPRHPDGVRYRLAFVPRGFGRPAVLYDNHHPKGHHKHIDGRESAYAFEGVERLIDDFNEDVAAWKRRAEA